MFPKMGSQSPRRISLQGLNGGLNLADEKNHIYDNQLTACENLWWHDGALRTRPGFAQKDSDVLFEQPPSVLSGGLTYRSIGTLRASDETVYHAYLATRRLNSDIYPMLLLIAQDGTMQKISVGAQSISCASGETVRLLAFSASPVKGCGIFVLAGVFGGDKVLATRYVYEVAENMQSCIAMQDEDFYAPVVYVNGKGNNYSTLPADENTEYAKASAFEGFNMLGGAFRAMYKTDGVSDKFYLPVSGIDEDKPITLTYTDSRGNQTVYTIPAGSNASNTKDQGGGHITRVDIDRNNGILQFKDAGAEGEVYCPGFFSGTNNLIIRAYKTDLKEAGKLFGMTFSAPFGGAEGLYGGSRIFVSGSEEHPNLVCWSDLNNPLYFPENNYAYVGEPTQRVTAFGKQGNMLVIFKSHEMYYTTYVEGNEYTAEDVISGRIVDVTAVSAVFPIVQIHGSIGCDCPDTVALCGNRLVWATKEGCAYTLVTAYNTSATNVYEISETIEPLLRNLDLSGAFALDWQGHYILFAGDKALLLDYRKSAYRNISYYSDSAQTQRKLAWYVWTLPQSCESGAAIWGNCVLAAVQKNESDGTVQYQCAVYALEGTGDAVLGEDGISPVAYRFSTKLFDFSRPELRKWIDHLYLSARGKGLCVAYETERGTRTEIPRDSQKPEGMLHLLPRVSRACMFGVSVSGEGEASFGSVAIRFRYMGSVK